MWHIFQFHFSYREFLAENWELHQELDLMRRHLRWVEFHLHPQAVAVCLPTLVHHQVLVEVNIQLLLHSPAASISNFLFLLLAFSACLVLCVAYIFSFIPSLLSQSLEFPKKSAPIPRDATADSAECCSASCPAAGDRQGEPWFAAGEVLRELDVLHDKKDWLLWGPRHRAYWLIL